MKRQKVYKSIYSEDRLDEGLTIGDLMQNAGLSDWSLKFAKETSRLMGSAAKHTKLINAIPNKEEDYITFNFVTERTPKYDDEEIPMRSVNPKNFTLQKDNLYQIQIRFMNFFSLLDTRPDLSVLTNKDIEDTIMACDIKIWDECPSYQYFGGNYAMTVNDAAIYPETRPPKYWQKFTKNDNYLSKHSQSIANSILFFVPIMRQMVKKYIKLEKS